MNIRYPCSITGAFASGHPVAGLAFRHHGPTARTSPELRIAGHGSQDWGEHHDKTESSRRYSMDWVEIQGEKNLYNRWEKSMENPA